MFNDRDSVHTLNIMLHQKAKYIFVYVANVSIVLCDKSRL